MLRGCFKNLRCTWNAQINHWKRINKSYFKQPRRCRFQRPGANLTLRVRVNQLCDALFIVTIFFLMWCALGRGCCQVPEALCEGQAVRSEEIKCGWRYLLQITRRQGEKNSFIYRRLNVAIHQQMQLLINRRAVFLKGSMNLIWSFIWYWGIFFHRARYFHFFNGILTFAFHRIWYKNAPCAHILLLLF